MDGQCLYNSNCQELFINIHKGSLINYPELKKMAHLFLAGSQKDYYGRKMAKNLLLL